MTFFNISMEQLKKWGKALLSGESKEEKPFKNESTVVNNLAREKLCEWIGKNGVKPDNPGIIEAYLKKTAPTAAWKSTRSSKRYKTGSRET